MVVERERCREFAALFEEQGREEEVGRQSGTLGVIGLEQGGRRAEDVRVGWKTVAQRGLGGGGKRKEKRRLQSAPFPDESNWFYLLKHTLHRYCLRPFYAANMDYNSQISLFTHGLFAQRSPVGLCALDETTDPNLARSRVVY
jgi:hypothetical protein